MRGLWDAIKQSTNHGSAASARRTINLRPLLHLSEQAVLKFPWKLITGAQPFSGWTGPLWPNCSTHRDASGSVTRVAKPVAQGLKIFDRHVNLSDSAAGEDALSWTHDCGAGGCLFNIDADPAEHVDLAALMPAKAAELRADLARLNLHLFKPGRGTMDPAACYQGVDHGGYYGPFAGNDLAGWYTHTYRPTPVQRLSDLAFRAEIAALRLVGATHGERVRPASPLFAGFVW